MKEPGTHNWTFHNTGADNSSGWAGLPGGDRTSNGSFGGIGKSGKWWSSTELLTSSAWYRGLDGSNGDLTRDGYGGKRSGFSVRCLRD
jgi:uncharacterized protein (TIGR02145 family)